MKVNLLLSQQQKMLTKYNLSWRNSPLGKNNPKNHRISPSVQALRMQHRLILRAQFHSQGKILRNCGNKLVPTTKVWCNKLIPTTKVSNRILKKQKCSKKEDFLANIQYFFTLFLWRNIRKIVMRLKNSIRIFPTCTASTIFSKLILTSWPNSNSIRKSRKLILV